jgi:hypothetical protein
MAPSPITYSEIDAWARLTKTRPSAREISIIRRIDDAMLRKWSNEAKEERAKWVDPSDADGSTPSPPPIRTR